MNIDMDGRRNCVLINQENVWRICVSARKFLNMDGQGINTKSIAVQHVYYHENHLDRKVVSSYEERNIMHHNSTNYGYNRRI
jgi:hypothetical protein